MFQVDTRDDQLSRLSGLILWGETQTHLSHTCTAGSAWVLIGWLHFAPQIVESGRLVVSTKCGHVFCSQCLRDALTSSHTCPTCRKRLTHRQYHPLYVWCHSDIITHTKWHIVSGGSLLLNLFLLRKTWCQSCLIIESLLIDYWWMYIDYIDYIWYCFFFNSQPRFLFSFVSDCIFWAGLYFLAWLIKCVK